LLLLLFNALFNDLLRHVDARRHHSYSICKKNQETSLIVYFKSLNSFSFLCFKKYNYQKIYSAHLRECSYRQNTIYKNTFPTSGAAKTHASIDKLYSNF
jgi:hypothetical protein